MGKRWAWVAVIVGTVALGGTGAVAASAKRTPVSSTGRDVAAEAARGSWLADVGMGLFFDPSLFLINPTLEYVLKPHLTVGPNVQVGLGDATLFTASAMLRLILGHHPRVKPCLEGDLGMAFASSAFKNSVGAHIGLGVGMDYQLERGIAIGTLFRANFMPPLRNFMLSWPILIARFAI